MLITVGAIEMPFSHRLFYLLIIIVYDSRHIPLSCLNVIFFTVHLYDITRVHYL